MGRKQVFQTQADTRSWRTYLRYVSASVAAVFLAIAGVFLYHRLDQFLANSPRFRLALPSGDADNAQGLRIHGLVHASRERVVNVFSGDLGRSLYLLPLSERRRDLLAIDWVKDASVSRLWPDRLVVRIVERRPVAFVQLPLSRNSGTFRMALIDAEGVILEPPGRAQFNLPVLTGIRTEQAPEMRRQRVRLASQLMREVGRLANNISEIDVSDPENLKVSQQLDGRGVVLMLGNQHFLARIQNFVDHYPEIHKRLAQATIFDLRLDDRITAIQEGAGG
jgi:cell division protein FtsQ